MPTFVSAPLPDLDLEEQSVITVDTGDALAVITGMVVHFTQDVPDVPLKIALLPPLLVHEPQTGTEAPGKTP